jgi:bacterioferritin
MSNNIFANAYFNILNENANRYSTLVKEFNEKPEITEADIFYLLNVACCDEILAAFNYKISYNLSKTEGKSDFDPEFEQHEDEENDHADKLIERIREMNFEPLLTPWCEYLNVNSVGTDWKQETSNDSILILKNRFKEELEAVRFYKFVLNTVHRLKKRDSSTEMLIKHIIADEEKHVKDLRDLLVQYKVDISKIEV